MCLMEKIRVLDKVCPGLSHTAAGHELYDTDPKYTLNKMSLNRERHVKRYQDSQKVEATQRPINK